MINYAELFENIEHAEDCRVNTEYAAESSNTWVRDTECDCWRAGVVELVEYVAELEHALTVLNAPTRYAIRAEEREACASLAKHHAKIQLIRGKAEDNDYARERAIEAESIWTDILARGGKS